MGLPVDRLPRLDRSRVRVDRHLRAPGQGVLPGQIVAVAVHHLVEGVHLKGQVEAPLGRPGAAYVGGAQGKTACSGCLVLTFFSALELAGGGPARVVLGLLVDAGGPLGAAGAGRCGGY